LKKFFSKKIALGFLSSGFGFPIGFVYFSNIENSSPLLLGIATPLVFAGVYFLGGAAANGVSKLTGITTAEDAAKSSIQSNPDKSGLNSILQKNNAMVNDWTKTNKVKNELEVLEMSAAIEDSSQKKGK
jgi:hypothetical protein